MIKPNIYIMKRVFRFILIMVMAIAYTMTADAKDVFFATHRTEQDEFGEIQPTKLSDAYCPTRIEVDTEAKTLLIKTKTRGTASYTFSDFTVYERMVSFFDDNDNIIGSIVFINNNLNDFVSLTINKKNNTTITYFNKDNLAKKLKD